MQNKPQVQLSIDGLKRSNEAEKNINDNLLTCFTTDAGVKVIQYLRSITIELVAGSNITDQELRHREGMRFLVGIIEQRIKEGKNARTRKPN